MLRLSPRPFPEKEQRQRMVEIDAFWHSLTKTQVSDPFFFFFFKLNWWGKSESGGGGEVREAGEHITGRGSR